ncbi:DUF4291 domain-containing protein [Streptomyces sp. NPDC088116]|uniref:DUF4291 domain-containing protein n=1 Tax=Streptomyces sp. NPDC088116 TaxID=3365825 RepID=UPI00382BD7CE
MLTAPPSRGPPLGRQRSRTGISMHPEPETMQPEPETMQPEPETERQQRRVRAVYGESSITVYQAYPREIAERAVEAGTFVAPFKKERMTWIKPSFLWMMYRSGWATKPNQERVLAVEITRAGFEWALDHSSLSHFDRQVHADKGAWMKEVKESPVRVQWDPDRSPSLAPLPTRAIQIGLSGEAVELYVHDWIIGIDDVTDLVRSIHSDMCDGQSSDAAPKTPQEREYPLPDQIRRRIGADG